MDRERWESLPHEILVDVLLYLLPADRFNVSLVCRSWNQCFNLGYIWSRFTFRFLKPGGAKCLEALDSVGSHMTSVCIVVDQHDADNRTNACKAVVGLARLPERRLRSLKIRFVGENPMLYVGQEFIDALDELFGPPDDRIVVNRLTTVDLSGLHVALDGHTLLALARNNSQLESLNVQSRVLVCKVLPDDMLQVVEICRRLKELCVFNSSLSDEVLEALAANDRRPLWHLSVACRWQDKYTKDICSAAWSKLVESSPRLRVTLAFDHSCLMHTVANVMKPEIPVVVLRLETFTDLGQEIVRACNYYKNTLEKVVVECPKSQTSEELDSAVVKLSSECKRLRSLHVFCVLQKDTVERVLAEHPGMHYDGTYTLKYVAEPHPWIPGRDCDN